MTTFDVPLTAAYTAESASADVSEITRRRTIANIWVAVIAFAVATAMAVMQAMSRANLDELRRLDEEVYR